MIIYICESIIMLLISAAIPYYIISILEWEFNFTKWPIYMFIFDIIIFCILAIYLIRFGITIAKKTFSDI